MADPPSGNLYPGRILAMSTFYVLPPRPHLGECFAGYLRSLFPGLDWDSASWPELADTLETAVADRAGVYVVFPEELPEDEEVDRALTEVFGAEDGDEVIEVRAGPRPGELRARRWWLGSATLQRPGSAAAPN
jgi:hypothetical protein